MPDVGEIDRVTQRIGHDLLGPIVHKWMLSLHQFITYFDDGDSTLLFCSRAGIRIERLYEIFLKSNYSTRVSSHRFWVSRISVAKGTFSRAESKAAALIAREYKDQPIHELVRGILRYNPSRLTNIDLSLDEYKAHGVVFPGWINGPTPAAAVLRSYFKECGDSLDKYIDGLTGRRSRVLLVDSGWQGSMQALLEAAYPTRKWRGLYFGRTLIPGAFDPAIVDNVIGLMFERDQYDASLPESAFVRHRHVIESLLETNGPSVEEVPGGPSQAETSRIIDANISGGHCIESDRLYLEVVKYLEGEGKGASISEIYARHDKAMAEMEKIILTPTRAEAMALRCKDRSADFGKIFKVPVLLDSGLEPNIDKRIERSLWPEGQIALEYDGEFAKDLQRRSSGLVDAASYFTPEQFINEDKNPVNGCKVSVITRTKNRPLLLRRAAESIASQIFSDYVWVIVNDGGDLRAVQDVVASCHVDRRKIVIVDNNVSQGMEAASNAGIRNSSSNLIVIHDDDDSWQPEFLQKTVLFMESPAGRRYGGVITHTTYISEEISGANIIEHMRQPYMNWVRSVQLTEMAAHNMFPPIAFVFRRSLWEEIGGFNEKLPVLGDWYYNLEFLLRADIGVIPTALANYHHRDRGDNSAYANSVVAGISKHEEYAAVARNEFIRRNSLSFPGAVAAVFGYFAHDIRGRQIDHSTGNSAQNLPQVAFDSNCYSDKYWAIIHYNQNYRSSKFRFIKKSPRMLFSNSSWNEIQESLIQNPFRIPIPPDFDEERYLTQNPDVAIVVGKGQLFSGYLHFLMSGRREGRARPTR